MYVKLKDNTSCTGGYSGQKSSAVIHGSQVKKKFLESVCDAGACGCETRTIGTEEFNKKRFTVMCRYYRE